MRVPLLRSSSVKRKILFLVIMLVTVAKQTTSPTVIELVQISKIWYVFVLPISLFPCFLTAVAKLVSHFFIFRYDVAR